MQGSIFPEYPHIPSDQDITQSLKTIGYANLPFALGKGACQELFSRFSDFVDLCNEPGGEELVEAVTFSVNDIGNGAYQLNYRRPGEINPNEIGRAPGKDHKYIFHFGSQTIARARTKLGETFPREMEECLGACEEFYIEAWKSSRIAARVLGVEGVLFSGRHEDDVHHLRLIDYMATDEPLLGEDHFDRSWGTLAFTESKAGLYGVPGDNGFIVPVSPEYIHELEETMTPIEHHEYIAKFFLGAGVNRLPSPEREKHDGLPLLAHGIKNVTPGEKRQAGVFFLNPHNKFCGYSVPKKFETGLGDIIESMQQKLDSTSPGEH